MLIFMLGVFLVVDQSVIEREEGDAVTCLRNHNNLTRLLIKVVICLLCIYVIKSVILRFI